MCTEQVGAEERLCGPGWTWRLKTGQCNEVRWIKRSGLVYTVGILIQAWSLGIDPGVRMGAGRELQTDSLG